LADEIKNAENFYESHFGKNAKDLEIMLCSGGSGLIDIDLDLEKLTNRKAVLADPLINVSNPSDEKQRNAFLPYTTAIGLALREIK